MALNCLDKSAEWGPPIFKVLANNDTGSAPGHQGGVVIPEALRQYFPQLKGSVSPQHPTIDQRMEADLFAENAFLATVSTRYQYQTWGGARSPESRLTDQLGPLRNLARGGDILVIQRRADDSSRIRLTLVRKSCADYSTLAALTGTRRWGALVFSETIKGEDQAVTIEEEESDDAPSAKDLDTSLTPYWGAVAYVARCARRFLECYEKDSAEPSAQRATVSQAVALAEIRAASGGAPSAMEHIELDGQYFDNYDIAAIATALAASENAADNTYTDLHENRSVERPVARIFTAICLARLAFDCAFASELDDGELTHSSTSLPECIRLAIDWAIWGEIEVNDSLVRDYEQLTKHVAAHAITDHDAFPSSLFGELWPEGRPASWPPIQLSFRPRARIIRTIGDRLVSGPEAAVIELVKNSYDADASFVRITFFPALRQNEGAILFEDDGHGMTLEDIEQKWMEPATSDKRDRKHTARGRRLLGSKGIGRFAASRLGRFLELVSTANRPAPTGKVAISSAEARLTSTRIPELDWDAFEEAKYLDDVSFPVESLTPKKATGTELKVSSLRDEWPEQRILKLHGELRKLVSPIPAAGASAFRIFLNLSHCTLENSTFDGAALLGIDTDATNASLQTSHDPYEVKPFPLLDACDYAVDGVFDESGRFEGTMTIQRGGLEPEEIILEVPPRLDDGEEPCGVVLVRLHVFDRESTAIRSTAAKAGFGAIGIRDARKLLDNIAGVAIYREGFRIRPYGDGENDWLTLDAKRVQNPTIKIGRNQIAGIISLDDERESQLVERSSREGLEENGSFRRLRSLISALLAEIVEPKRRQFRIRAGLDGRPESSFRDIYDRVQMGWSKLLVAKIPEADRPAAEELIAKESDRLTQYVKRLEDRQAQLEARVTLGLIIGEVMHQGNTPLSFLENEVSRLRRWWPSLLDSSARSQERLLEVPRILNGMDASGEKLRILFNALNPLSGARRGAPKEYDVREVIEKTLYLFKSKIEKIGIDVLVESDIIRNIVTGYYDDLSTAVTNLVDNAVYWLEYHNISGPTLRVSISAAEDRCIIVIADNGTGVPAEFADQLFDIGFTLKPNGTGLGLSIAKEAVFRSNGELELLVSNCGAAFQISLPLAK
ncbi:MAG: ATP-binding protein [Collimonas sp.]|uniref:ATP-binding protein n=1 Tax=Collimonas sp. TaxID=1963772 RepID=UPI0032639E2C